MQQISSVVVAQLTARQIIQAAQSAQPVTIDVRDTDTSRTNPVTSIQVTFTLCDEDVLIGTTDNQEYVTVLLGPKAERAHKHPTIVISVAS